MGEEVWGRAAVQCNRLLGCSIESESLAREDGFELFRRLRCWLDEPFLGRDGTVSLARSFLRELLARADYSTSALLSSRSRLESPSLGCAQE